MCNSFTNSSRCNTTSANCIPTRGHALSSCLPPFNYLADDMTFEIQVLLRSSHISLLRITSFPVRFTLIRRLLLRWSATCSPPRRSRRQYQIRFISLLRITSTWNIPYTHIKNMIAIHLNSHNPSGTLALTPSSSPSLSIRHCRCLHITHPLTWANGLLPTFTVFCRCFRAILNRISGEFK